MDNNQTQMAELFEEGGIADDGMRVDPVSGNEIPPGSMASEVRDDVPAQLSEGEYVVPADVLRFYGVKFFEDLRSEAKQGMMKMEVDGRIGGEPVAAEGQQDMDALTPEEMAVLQEMGMAAGGMVPQQRVGYNEAGLVSMPGILEDGTNANTMAANVSTQYGRGSGIDRARGVAPATTAAVRMVMLYSPDGLTSQAFTLPAQQVEHDAKIAEGWSATQVGLTTDTSVGPDPNEDYGGPLDSDTGKDKKKFSEMTPTEIQQAYNDNLKARNLLTGMGLINPVFAIAGRITTNLAEKQIVARMDVLKIKPPEDEGFFKSIGDNIKDAGSALKDFFGIEEDKTITPTEKDPIYQTDDSFLAPTPSLGNDDPDPFETTDTASEIVDGEALPVTGAVVKPRARPTTVEPTTVDKKPQYLGNSGKAEGGFISKRSKKKNK